MEKTNWIDKLGKRYNKRAEELAVDLWGSPTWQDVATIEKILVHGGMIMHEQMWKERLVNINKMNGALILEGTFRA